jgi:uncharacterized protein YjbI with pentapeptide repeats
MIVTAEKKECPVCGESIKQSATKCIHCSEFIDQGPFGLKGKTLWDWLGLLIVPITLALIGFGFSWFQSYDESNRDAARKAIQDERDATREAIQDEREASRSKAQADLQGTTEAGRANSAALAAYLNDITGLIASAEGDLEETLSTPIRARTIATLNELDATRNAIVLEYLREAGMMPWVLKRANLIGADLEFTNLRNADLSNSNLGNARLKAADLYSADLSDANLGEADLSSTDMRKARLVDTDLPGANLAGADLREAVLKNAYMPRANLDGANLKGADLAGANLTGVEYTIITDWPEDFGQSERETAGAILVDESGNPVEE